MAGAGRPCGWVLSQGPFDGENVPELLFKAVWVGTEKLGGFSVVLR